jgi:hypothetical protein
MITRNRTRTVLTLAAVAMAILVTTTHQVSAAVLTHDATVEVSDNHSVFDVSVFPGKAGYDDGTDSGVFGDGTVVDYRFFNNSDTTFNGTGYADGGAGLVSEATATNSSGTNGGALHWADVWTTSDPDAAPADFTSGTVARSQGVSGTIDISGLRSGTLYFIYGSYFNPNTVALTMTGSGQPTVDAQHVEDPPNTTNKAFVTGFSFADASLYDQISYTYTNTDTDASRARFMGVIVDGAAAYPKSSSDPSPEDGLTDVSRNVILSWTPGIYADKHDVYFGTVFDDVNDRVGGFTQIVSTYDPGRLEFDTTYYWRVDEVNAPPDSTVYEGRVWSFTTEPVGYPIENVTATASSSATGQGPENTVNGSGLSNDLHSIATPDMWLSGLEGPQPTWIQFEFDEVYKLHEMWVWNSNSDLEMFIGFGCRDVAIEYSVDGIDYATLGTTHEFAQAPGTPGYAHNTAVDLGALRARYVRLTPNSNWGDLLVQYGLSEVRFFSIPVNAREPSPESGSTDVDLDLTLSWRAGREAAEHNVYLSTEEQAVIDGNAPVTTVTEASYSASLDVGSTYYWRVDEVNAAETPTTWQGDIWNLSTPEFLVVDDFESYNDLNPDDPESNRIFLTWIGGDDDPANGSQVGHDTFPFAEQTIVFGGSQSMPFSYDNITATYSEATANIADLQVDRDWTKGAPETLVVRIRGDMSNAAAGQLYVKVNGKKVMYGGDLSVPIWKQWNVDLASLGISLSNITTLSIGVDGGGSGMLYVDDIALYRIAPPVTEPTPGGDRSLVGHWKLDETSGLTTADGSGYGNHGTLMNGLTGTEWAAGTRDGALMLKDGQYVDFGNDPSLWLNREGTISAWVKMEPANEDLYMGIGGKLVSGPYNGYELVRHSSNVFRLWMGNDGGDLSSVNSDVTYNDTDWHHVVGVVSNNTGYLYVDGVKQAEESACGIVDTGDFAYIGKHYSTGTDRYWIGTIDDFRMYYRALSAQEVSGL